MNRMSDAYIPKDNLTAYQRWELPAFDAVPEPSRAAALRPPTAAQIEHIHQQAHDEGYQAGYADGADKARRLTELLEALDKELQQADQQIAQEMLNLSLEIARQVLQQALKVKPELLLSVVRAAISELPHFNQHSHLLLHPADAELVRSSMGEQLQLTGCKILEDAHVMRGGCRIETAQSQIDATLPTRWKRVTSAIGQDSAWLDS
ncbi:MAG: flagellar assembly protein FliH [Pseudomonadota bacterium]